MWNEEQITSYVRETLTLKRFNHVIGVKDTALKMAIKFKCDEQKVIAASLIHDCAKYMGDENLLNIVKGDGYMPDEIEEKSPQLLHGRAAAIIAKNKMGIDDEDILNSVVYHTTGRIHMSLLEKIIYVADYIEPGRSFPGIEMLRKTALENIEDAMLLALNNTIKYVLDKNQLLHINTIKARNYLLQEKNVS